MTGGQQHWNTVYGARSEDELTWFEAMPAVSLDLVREHLQPGEPFIDIRAGASRLVDALLDDGFGPLTMLHVSGAALAVSRQRLGPQGDDVAWIEADITIWEPDRDYAVWHERAVFHFLTGAKNRAGYAHALSEAVRPGGIAIIATFADDGPEMCSGLPLVRYAPEALAQELNRLQPGRFEMQRPDATSTSRRRATGRVSSTACSARRTVETRAAALLGRRHSMGGPARGQSFAIM